MSSIKIIHGKILPNGKRAPKRSRFASMSVGSYFIAPADEAKRLADSCYKYFYYYGGNVQRQTLEDGRMKVTRIA